MLRQKVLVEVLGEANTADVVGAQLLSREGQLLAFSGFGIGSQNQASVSSALISTIWAQFDKNAAFSSSGDLKELIVECEDGFLCAAPLANMLLVLKAKNTVKLGLLRTKLRAVAKHLEEPLTLIAQANAEEEAKEKRKRMRADDY